ncbi:kinase-like protein [Ustulina deusta]|nr:kinase-like protein [Ustulina deusta]
MANLSAHELDPELTALVDEIDPRDKRNLNDSRRRILAILIMGDIPNLIIHFIDEGIGDRHLPFEYQHDGQLEYTKDDGRRAVCPFRCFDNDPSKLYNFEISQWDYMAPVFSFTEEEVHHHQIQYRIPLPFTEDNIVPTQGGNSQVRQVVIHHEHHDLTDGNSFAVKRLLCSTDENFNKEVEALKLVRKLRHPHLIELLGTFQYRQSYYLIFQWAIDDLQTFWKSNPSFNPVPTMSRWALQQCLEIARGLHLIHGGQCPPPGRSGLRGRHGDIKPANILRYAPRAGSEDSEWGVLKISDFGLTRFYENHSYRREYINGPPATRTYRSPEGDLQHEVSYLWDIWPLGCLYLEFVTWLLQGWDGVVAFAEEREREDQSRDPRLYKEDKFFNINPLKIFGACRKTSVIDRIRVLHSHPECTEFIHDFLDLISKDLIRIRDRKRAKCDQIVQKLEAMGKKCENNEDYYTQPQIRPLKTLTCESDKSCNPTATVPNVGHISGESRSSRKPGSSSESGAEENSPSRLKNEYKERRYLRRFLYFVRSCIHGDAIYS